MTAGWTFVFLLAAIAGLLAASAVAWFSSRSDALRIAIALFALGAACYVFPFLWNAGEAAF